MGPTLTGFQWFLTSIVGIPLIYLPADAPIIPWAYDIAFATVNPIFSTVPSGQTPNSPIIYQQMVYNLGAHYVVSWAPDVQPPVVYKTDSSGNPLGYFEYLRQSFGLNSFVPGVVEETEDVTTKTKLHIPEGFDKLTVGDLSTLQTPWGRAYFNLAQAWNRPWGIS